MAIAFDTATEADKTVWTGSPDSFSHTCTGSDRGLLFHFGYGVSSALSSMSATYNGTSMTIEEELVNTNRGLHMLSLTNPDSGSNTLTVTYTRPTGFSDAWAAAWSYTGVDQTDMVEASSQTTIGASTTLDISVTTLTDNAWGAASWVTRENRTITVSSPTVERYQNSGEAGVNGVTSGGGDEVQATAGSCTLVWTSGSSEAGPMTAVAIKPSAGGGATFVPKIIMS